MKTWRAFLVIGTLLLTACAGGPATKKQQHYSKGTHYLAAGEYNEAVLEFRTALQVDPGFADAHHQLGLTYWHKGWIPDARFELEAAVRLSPDREPFALDLADLLVDLGLGDDGLRLADAAVRRDARSARAHYLRGRALALKGETAPAETAFRTALGLDPMLADAQSGLGHLYLERRQLAQAEEVFNTARRLRANHVDALLGLGALRLEGGQVEQPRASFEPAVRAESESGLALAYLTSDRAEPASATLEEIVRHAPDEPNGHYLLGQMYLRRGMGGEALREFQSVQRLAPAFPDLALGLANAHLQTATPHEAVRLLEAALKKTPDDPRLYGVLGLAYAALRDFPHARTALQRAVELDP
ncbi:MAG: hypothetical protein DME13_23005, partial [Candidatus Rokuibacteriota bacterium]